jgi:hypothetical protein
MERPLKIRARRFSGRCARHKGYNPAVDGRGGIRGNCARCNLLMDIYEAAMKLNGLIRKFDPNHDDAHLVKKPQPAPAADPRQMSLIE